MTTSRKIVDNLLRGKKAERVALMGAPWGDTIAANPSIVDMCASLMICLLSTSLPTDTSAGSQISPR